MSIPGGGGGGTPGFVYEFNRLESGGMSTAIAGCNVRTEYDTNAGNTPRTQYGHYRIVHASFDDLSNVAVGDFVYQLDGSSSFDGDDEWYGVRQSGSADAVDAEIVIKVDSTGEIDSKFTCANLGTYSVSGSIPYVDYYAGNFYMYKTGSTHYSSIEGAVSQSLLDFGIEFSASNFQQFISASLVDAYDPDITGPITSVLDISSSLQFQGYPISGSSGIDEPV
jgi:hypothetical protein